MKINKLQNISFIYLVTYTTCISNLIFVNKKQGTICSCTNFCGRNNAYPKDNYHTPFIDQLIDAYARHEVVSFKDGLFGYNQI